VAILGRLPARIVSVFDIPAMPVRLTAIVSVAPVLSRFLSQLASLTVPPLAEVIVWVLSGQPPLQVTVIVAPAGTPLTESVAKRVKRFLAFM
jgi:hypothetical protein